MTYYKILDLFGLEIPFDGSDEMNISQMIFSLMYGLGQRAQYAMHTNHGISPDIQIACLGTKMWKENALGTGYKR